jgi:hypothetical protein
MCDLILVFACFSTHVPSSDHYGLLFGEAKCSAVVYIKTYWDWVCIKLEYVLHYCYLYICMWYYFNSNCCELVNLSNCCTFLLHFFVIYFLITEMLHVIIDWNHILKMLLFLVTWLHALTLIHLDMFTLLCFIIYFPLIKMMYEVMINVAGNYVLYTHS